MSDDELHYVVSITPTLRQRLQIAAMIILFVVFITAVALVPDRSAGCEAQPLAAPVEAR